jgi:hypothetical protein
MKSKIPARNYIFTKATSFLMIAFFLAVSSCNVQGFSEKKIQKPNDYFTEKTIDILIEMDNENFVVKSLRVINRKFHFSSNYDMYKNVMFDGKIVSYQNGVLGYFGLPRGLSVVACSDGVDESGQPSGGCTSLPKGETIIQAPYFSNGKYAEIYDPFGKKVLTIDLSSKATCNENGKCDRPVEDGENCPQDCRAGEAKIDPVLMKQVEAEREAAREEEEKVSLSDLGWWPLIIGILLLLGGIGAGYWFWRKNREERV